MVADSVKREGNRIGSSLPACRSVPSLRSWRWLVCLALLAPISCQSPQTEGGDFLAGKTLRITTSNSPGGGFDFYMRLTARHLEQTQGVAAAAQNIEGAGGTLGDNKLFHARPDGLTIGLINGPGHIFAQLREHPGVQYDFRDWKWLGRVAAVSPAIAVAPQSDLRNLEDLVKSDRPIRFGLEGRGSDAYYGTVLLANVLGIPVRQIVGYSGPGEITGAMLAGEIDARFESVDTLLPLINQGELRLLFLLDRQRDSRLPDVAAIPDVDVSPGAAGDAGGLRLHLPVGAFFCSSTGHAG